MAQDLHTVTFGLASGTVTSDEYDVSRHENIEVFVRSGTAVAGASVTTAVYVDARDLDGNWFNGVGTVSVGTSTTGVLGMRRGANIGAAPPAVLGASQRIRTVSTGGTAEIGVNVVGY